MNHVLALLFCLSLWLLPPSESNPVLCHQPSGEREYLDRLRCSHGDAPWHERVGADPKLTR